MPFKKFKETVRKYRLIEEGDRVLVAYSGGPDSTVLLYFLKHFQRELPYQLAVAHFNHKLRPEADEEEEFAAKMAQRFRLEFFSGAEDVRAYAKEHSLNLEEAARILRYRFLEETARAKGFNKIATGHTMTDQAETFLYRLIRGSGRSGLSGIYPVKEGLYIRPLIEITRREIMEFLQRVRLPYVEDPSNLCLTFDRNRIRHKLIPFLEENFSPKIVHILAREAEIFRDEDEFLESLVEKELQQRCHEVFLDVPDWQQLHKGFRRRLVRGFIRRMKGDLRRIGFDHIEHVVNLKPGQEYFLPGGARMVRLGKSFLYLTKAPEVKSYSYTLNPGETITIAECGLTLKASYFEGKPDFSDPFKAYLDAGKLSFPLKVREWRRGDKYVPVGATFKKKISDIFCAKGIPRHFRRCFPVLLSGEEIVWVVGLRVGRDYAVAKDTEKILLVEALPDRSSPCFPEWLF